MKGSLLTEVVLWCFFLVPGLIYSIWRHASVYYGCAKCGAGTVIPLDSPIARKLLPEGYIEPILPGYTPKPISPRVAWGILLLIIGVIGLAIALSR